MCQIGIITFILIAALIGFLAWAATSYIPMPPPIKTVIIIAAVIVVVVMLLSALGLLPMSDVPIPRVK